MFVQLLNQNATNILEKTRRFMAFQISVTHRFLPTPFCQQAAEAALERGEGVGKERARAERGMGRDRGDLWGDKGWPRGWWWWSNLNGNSGQEGHGKSPIQFCPLLGFHLHVALPCDQSYHLNISGPATAPAPPPSTVLHTRWRWSKTSQSGKRFTSLLAPRAETVCIECKAIKLWTKQKMH